MNDRRDTATHEAGHAVIGRVLGMACGGASIVANGQFAGESICEDPAEAGIWQRWRDRGRFRKDNLAYRARIMTFMAGAEAESVLSGGCQGGDGDDQYRIDEMIEAADFSPEHWSHREPRMRATTRMLVRRHRSAIERVAAALLDKGALSGDEIDGLIQKI